MDDTTPEVRQLLAQRYQALKPEERVRLCLDMYDFARSLVEASLPPGLDERERRRRICGHFYGVELANRVFPSMKKESP